jgi:multidrug resistance efflux pump
MAPKEFKDPRPSADAGRKLESAKAALKKQENKQGASVEEITAELNRAKKAYESAVSEVKTMVALNKVRVFSMQRQGRRCSRFMTTSARADRLGFVGAR